MSKTVGDFLEAVDYPSLSRPEREYVKLCVRAFFHDDREALDLVTRHALENVDKWAEDWEDLEKLREGNRAVRREAGLPEVWDA